MDEEDNEVKYFAGMEPNQSTQRSAIATGALKVSHRKMDPVKSKIYQPFHTNLKEDYAPLTPGEIVEAQVAIWPGTAYVRKGWRIRIDIQPESGCENGTRIMDVNDASYQIGALNSIYTGPDHVSYLQLPVIPPKN
jgi:predicted acyl esterase